LERAADIYKKLSDENLRKSQRESSSITKVDYMSVYTSGLVKAVRKAAGDLGITPLRYFFFQES